MKIKFMLSIESPEIIRPKIFITKPNFRTSYFTGNVFKLVPKFQGEVTMKKLLTLSILSLSILAGASVAEAKTSGAAAAAEPQIRVRIGQPGRYQRRVRVVNRTRIVRVGFRTYRETIQTRYLPNGRVTTRVISRVRIR